MGWKNSECHCQLKAFYCDEPILFVLRVKIYLFSKNKVQKDDKNMNSSIFILALA